MGYVVVALPLLIGRAGVLDSDFVATATYDLGEELSCLQN